MRIKINKAPYASRFSWWRRPPHLTHIRDLGGDFVLFIGGYQIKFWWGRIK